MAEWPIESVREDKEAGLCMESSLKLEGWQVQRSSPCLVDYCVIGLRWYKNPGMKSFFIHHPGTLIPIYLVTQQPKGPRFMMMLMTNQLNPLEVVVTVVQLERHQLSRSQGRVFAH